MIALLTAAALAGPIAVSSESMAARDIRLNFALGDVAAEGWHAEDLQISATLPHGQAGKLRLTVANLVWAAGAGRFSEVELSCDSLLAKDATWRCSEGRLNAAVSPLGALRDVPWVGQWDRQTGASIAVSALPVAGGMVDVTLDWHTGTWTVQSDLRTVRLDQLRRLFPPSRDWKAWSLGGLLSGTAAATGAGTDVQELRGRLKLTGFEFASPDGLQAAEGLELDGRLQARRREAAWDIDMSVASNQGQAYIDPVFVDAGANPLTFEGFGRWAPAAGSWDLDRWSLVQTDTLKADGKLGLSGPPFRVSSARVRVQSADLSGLYKQWIQPFMIGGVGEGLGLEGAGTARAQWDSYGLLAVDLEVEDLSAREQDRRFAIEGATGAWHWHRQSSVAPSRLRVGGGRLYRFPVGPFVLDFRARGPTLELLSPLELPMLDGAVRLTAFQADRRSDRLQAKASVVADGLDLAALTDQLGWPPLRGVLSGRLPNVSYDDGVIRTNDGLSFSAFDGEVALQGLVIRDVFGVLPGLEAEVVLRGLDLAALTEAFSFGRIEGRLDGELLNLELLGWQPNRFDLHLYTPQGSQARRRISQRAVENLTELGTGIPAGLSATVLKIFDEFRYDNIDIRVALRGDTAELGGLAAPNGGYYLVRGAGLPRIDVIGRNRQVGWKDLIRRLKNIRLEGAQIK
jgi:hypothetical protein